MLDELVKGLTSPQNLVETSEHYNAVKEFGLEVQELEVEKKVWGFEYILRRQPYTVKYMILNPGFQCSLHYHCVKKETFILLANKLIVDLIDPQNATDLRRYLSMPYDTLTIDPHVSHTFYCPKDQKGSTLFLECSTEDFKNDSYRITESRRIEF